WRTSPRSWPTPARRPSPTCAGSTGCCASRSGKMGIALTPGEQFEIFGTDKVTGEWAEEAERRWGETQAWAQSHRRAAAYTKQDWIDIQAGAAAINREFLAAMTAGGPAAC